MSAAEPLAGVQPAAEPASGPSYRPSPTPARRARRAPTRRELAWALLLSAVLTVGIIATLLFQTAMQGQARTLLREHDRAAALAQHDQSLHRALAHAADPAALAARAHTLHMRPQITPHFVRLGHHHANRAAHIGVRRRRGARATPVG